jgi:ferredoxin
VVAEPTPFARDARPLFEGLVSEDGWTACGACGQRLGFRIAGIDDESRVKCPNNRCRAWVRLAPRLRERVSRVLTT